MVGLERQVGVLEMIRGMYWNREQKETQKHRRDWCVHAMKSLVLTKAVLLLGE